MQAPHLNQQQIAALLRLYRRHEEWAQRSGHAAMDWPEFKRSRLANPLTLAAIGVQ